jgi:hypothetical protein
VKRIAGLAVAAAAALALGACERVDPGPNFVIADDTFDQNYFFCHVEPEVLFAKKCGPGDPAANDRSGGCHFNSSAVSGMALIDHAPVPCSADDKPDPASIGAGSAAQSNFQSASLEMSRDYLTAPIYVRPTGANHPRAIFGPGDPAVTVISTWAQK